MRNPLIPPSAFEGRNGLRVWVGSTIVVVVPLLLVLMVFWNHFSIITVVAGFSAAAAPPANWTALRFCRARAKRRGLLRNDVVTTYNLVGCIYGVAIPACLLVLAFVFIIVPDVGTTGLKGFLWESMSGLMIAVIAAVVGLIASLHVSMVSGFAAWWIAARLQSGDTVSAM